MLKKLFINEVNQLIDEQIVAVMSDMQQEDVDSEEYAKLLSILERLHKLKGESRRARISWDTVATICANLLGILMIIAYEQKHVMSSKALSQLMRPKAP